MAIPPFVSVPVAGVIPFDNSSNGFTSTDVQGAIEEAFAGAVFNNKFTFHLASLSAYDKVVEINYADLGQRTQRITSVVYSSVQYPNTNLIKNIFWLDVGSMKQRIDKIQYSGAILGSNVIQKTFDYIFANNKVLVDRYYYEIN